MISSPTKAYGLARCKLLTKFTVVDVNPCCVAGLILIRKWLANLAHSTGQDFWLSEAHFLFCALSLPQINLSAYISSGLLLTQKLHCLPLEWYLNCLVGLYGYLRSPLKLSILRGRFDQVLQHLESWKWITLSGPSEFTGEMLLEFKFSCPWPLIADVTCLEDDNNKN